MLLVVIQTVGKVRQIEIFAKAFDSQFGESLHEHVYSCLRADAESRAQRNSQEKASTKTHTPKRFAVTRPNADGMSPLYQTQTAANGNRNRHVAEIGR